MSPLGFAACQSKNCTNQVENQPNRMFYWYTLCFVGALETSAPPKSYLREPKPPPLDDEPPPPNDDECLDEPDGLNVERGADEPDELSRREQKLLPEKPLLLSG